MAGDGSVWRLVGPLAELSQRRCRLLHSSFGRGSDVCLFYLQGRFSAMDARCAHSGGPLCDGDIEEADGVLQVFCPWHDYDFNIRTGKSQTGLQNFIQSSSTPSYSLPYLKSQARRGDGATLREGELQ